VVGWVERTRGGGIEWGFGAQKEKCVCLFKLIM